MSIFYKNVRCSETITTQEMKFSIKDFFSKCDQNPQFPADFVTFIEEILN